MSIIDYTKKLILFDSYEIQVIKMLLNELNLEKFDDFKFLSEINLNNVEFFWYFDKNENVLGGFHFLSYDFKKKKYAVYFNKNFVTDGNSYFQKMNNIIMIFPTIVHELCHYWQSRKYSLLYLFLQLPFIREYTIEKHAYRVSDYLYENNDIQNLNMKDLVKLKQKYGFSKNYYDPCQKKYLIN